MISTENAYKSVVAFITSDVGQGFDLDNGQIEKLSKFLRGIVKIDMEMVPEAVLPFATEVFPHLGPQSDEDITEIANRYAASGHWQQVASGFLPPWGAGGSKANFVLLATAIRDHRATGKRVRVSDICEIVHTLASQGVLERVPQAPAPAPPPPPPPTPQELAREKAKKIVKFEKSLNDSSTSPIRGAKSKAAPLVDHSKPVLTEEAKAALNEKKRAEDATIAEAQHRIQTYRGASHSRTFSAKSHLTAVFTQAMDEGLDANAVLARVDQAINQLTDNGSIR